MIAPVLAWAENMLFSECFGVFGFADKSGTVFFEPKAVILGREHAEENA